MSASFYRVIAAAPSSGERCLRGSTMKQSIDYSEIASLRLQ